MNQPRKHLAFCPHCGNRSPQRVVYEHSYRDTWYSPDGTPTPLNEAPESEAILCICETCNMALLYDGLGYSETGGWPELVYPKGEYLPRSVPESVRSIYREAAVVKRNAPNAFAMMIRKGLEAICDDRAAPAGTLARRLKYMVEKGDIPPVLAEVTDVLRVVGNSAAHGSLQKITPNMTWAIDDFFRALIEYVYLAPSKLQEFRERLDSMKANGNGAPDV